MDQNAPSNEENDEPNVPDEGASESDTDSSIGIPLISVAPDEMVHVMKEKAEFPPDGLQWNDTAILDCWNVAIQGHDDPEPVEWRAPSLVNQRDVELLTNWRPKSISIPVYIVDPFLHTDAF